MIVKIRKIQAKRQLQQDIQKIPHIFFFVSSHVSQFERVNFIFFFTDWTMNGCLLSEFGPANRLRSVACPKRLRSSWANDCFKLFAGSRRRTTPSIRGRKLVVVISSKQSNSQSKTPKSPLVHWLTEKCALKQCFFQIKPGLNGNGLMKKTEY